MSKYWGFTFSGTCAKSLPAIVLIAVHDNSYSDHKAEEYKKLTFTDA